MAKKKSLQNFVNLTKEFTKAVTDYLLVETDLAPADVAIVFGNNCRSSLAEKAAELYQNGLVKKIIVSGGVHNRFPKTEAMDIRDRLIEYGIPETDILVENRARHTAENVIYSKALVEQSLGPDKVGTIIAVGSITASRRFLMTLKQHWPEALVMAAPVNVYGVEKDKWHTLKKFKKAVLKEFNKIAPYSKLGFLSEVDIDDINRRVKSLGRS